MLKERIEREINKKYWEAGKMGTETCNIHLTLTDEEEKEFFEKGLDSIYDYNLEGNELNICYSEE